MRPDALLALARRLSSRRERDQHGLLFIEGVRFLHCAARAGAIQRVVESKALLRSPAGQRLARQLRRRGLPCTRVSPEQFRAMSTAPRASGLAALARPPWSTLDQLGTGPLLLLRAVRADGNLGTLIRSAEALGGGGLVCVGPSIDPWSPAVVRASMGAVFDLPIVRTAPTALLDWTRSRPLTLLAARAEGAIALGAAPLPPRVGFLLGDERKGVAPEDLAWCDGSVRIPMVGASDSLNVAQAGTVLLYEATRGPAVKKLTES